MRSRFAAFLPILLAAFGASIALSAGDAHATAIQDLIRLKGHERVVVTGMGIVVGLNGTGDKSKDSLLAARPYAELLRNYGYPVPNIEELASQDSYAIVSVTMEIPPTGARDGDRFDISVETLFNAKSLEGGRLVVSLLRLPRKDSADLVPIAFGEGQIIIEGANPRSGAVRQGGQMITDLRANPVSISGTLTLVLKDQYAGYPVATMIADAVNARFGLDGFTDVAMVEDARNVRVNLPEPDRKRPADFIAALLTITIHPSRIQTEARIVINEREGIILVTGDVVVGAVGVRAAGLSITSVVPPPIATPDTPQIERTEWANLDTTDRSSRSSTKLIDLLRAFDQLKVPIQDQIAIIYELRKTGALHAEIVLE